MSNRNRQITQRVQAASEVNQRIQVARDQAIIRYFYRKRG